jgi:glycosyltransferase involved in cell wall biosynthesis
MCGSRFPRRRGMADKNPSKIYICRIDHEHDRIYSENVVEYLNNRGISSKIVQLADDGLRPELQECLDDPEAAVLGFNAALDHSWLKSGRFLDAAEQRGVPVVQWILDHPSARWAEFEASTPTNSRFLFNSEQQQRYFETYCLPGALTGTTGGVGPNCRCRVGELNPTGFSQRPITCLIPLSLNRVRSIEQSESAIAALEHPLGDAVREAIVSAQHDLTGSLHSHVAAALAARKRIVSPEGFNVLCQFVEEGVQTFRRLKIFSIAKNYPVLIQSDDSAASVVVSSVASFAANVGMRLTLERVPTCRAVLSVTPMNDMIHDRAMNALTAGCVAIIESNAANGAVFTHGENALLFRYDDDSLAECLDVVCNQAERAYEIARAGMSLRDDPRIRFGQFQSVVDLAQRGAERVLQDVRSTGDVPTADGDRDSETSPSRVSVTGHHRPELSVVVVVHNMVREASRTLYSLSPAYQRDIAADDYEIIVVDNGSSSPLDAEMVAGLEGNFRLIRLDPAPPSPARAVNQGLAKARGRGIGVMIDGARIVTPGLLHFARHGLGLFPRAVVVTLGWYLGRDYQRWAMEGGYNRDREDHLLASIDWPHDGYRLFEISAFDEGSVDGWFAPVGESNGLFLSREAWDLLGGVDERFDQPGGGFLNLDTLARAVDLPDSEMVILLGEATFHQLHGGIATNADYRSFPQTLAKWSAQYERIRGRPWIEPSPQNRTYIGMLPSAVLAHFSRSIIEPVRGLPLGSSFDRSLWSLAPSRRPTDPVCSALLALAEREFRERRFEAAAAVARIARGYAPDEPGPQHLLTHAGMWLPHGDPPESRRAEVRLARGKAYRLLGNSAAAEAEFKAVLAVDPDHETALSELTEMQ